MKRLVVFIVIQIKVDNIDYISCMVVLDKELGKYFFCLFIKNMSLWWYIRSGLPTDFLKGRGILTVRR